MNIACIYHNNDLDGLFSAAVVHKHFEINSKYVKKINLDQYNVNTDKNNDITLYFKGYNYGDKIDLNFKLFEEVILLDFSFDDELMLDLIKKHNKKEISFTWIDHHKNKVKHITELCKNNSLEMPFGKRDITRSACENAWDFYFPVERIPNLILNVGIYDTWRHFGTDKEKEIFIYEYGLRGVVNDLNTAVEQLDKYLRLSGVYDMKILKEGKIIYNYLVNQAKRIYKNKFELTFNILDKEYKFYAINADHFDPSHFGIRYDNEDIDGFVSFYYNGNNDEYRFSLRSQKVDVSEIARYFGGNGHKGAAGFGLTKEIFNLLINKEL